MLIPTKVLRDNAQVDNTVKPENQMSAAAVLKARRGIVTGIIRSVCMYLYQNNIEAKVVQDKITTILNAFSSTKEIDANDYVWMRDTYIPSLSSLRCAIDSECPYVAPSSPAYMYWWTIISNILDDTSVFEYFYEGPEQGPTQKLNDNEKAMIESYKQARNAYYSARAKFEEYFRKVTITALREVLLRHGTMFQQVAPDWYKEVSKSAGCNCPTDESEG